MIHVPPLPTKPSILQRSTLSGNDKHILPHREATSLRYVGEVPIRIPITIKRGGIMHPTKRRTDLCPLFAATSYWIADRPTVRPDGCLCWFLSRARVTQQLPTARVRRTSSYLSFRAFVKKKTLAKVQVDAPEKNLNWFLTCCLVAKEWFKFTLYYVGSRSSPTESPVLIYRASFCAGLCYLFNFPCPSVYSLFSDSGNFYFFSYFSLHHWKNPLIFLFSLPRCTLIYTKNSL